MKTTNDVLGKTELMRELLGAVVTFIAKTGMPMADIEELFRASLSASFNKAGKALAKRRPDVSFGCDTVAGAVLRAWHRLPIYLDSSARPIPLRFEGKSPCLRELIRSQGRSSDERAVLKSMVSSGLVRRNRRGAYVPRKESATIGALNSLAIDHVAKTVMRLVETASRNTTGSKGRLTLIERYAHVPDLAKAEARAFAVFSRQQGQAYLDTVEDWLESRQVGQKKPKPSEASINAGVHIFAFLGDEPAHNSPRLRRKTAKRPTASREARA
jgi:hypothetical protein